MAKNARNRRRTIATRATPTVPPSQKDCVLLNLPPEIRNLISEFVVAKPSRIELVVHIGKRNKKKPRWSYAKMLPVVGQPAYTRTCRQVRDEALPTFYRINKFEYYFAPVMLSVFLTEFTAMLEWCSTLGIKNQEALGKVLCCTREPVDKLKELMSLSAFASREMVDGWIAEVDETGGEARVGILKYWERLKHYAIDVPAMSARRSAHLERV